MRIQFGIEILEPFAIGAALERIAAVPDRPPLETAQPLEYVLRPTDRLAELAVADDIDADLGLLLNDFGHRLRQA